MNRHSPFDAVDEDNSLNASWENGEFVFRRAWRRAAGGKGDSVLVVLPAAEHPTPATLDRLAGRDLARHERLHRRSGLDHQVRVCQRSLTGLQPAIVDPGLTVAGIIICLFAGMTMGQEQETQEVANRTMRPVVRGPISAIRAIVAASAATTTVNIAAAP